MDKRKPYSKTNNNKNSQYRGKSKSNRPYSKDRELDEDGRKYDSGKGTNDISWYSINPTMLKDASSIPFNRPLGMTLPTKTNKTYMDGFNYESLTELGPDTAQVLGIPGIMRLMFTPTIGDSTTSTSACNIAAKRMYEFIRVKISGNTRNYEPADLMLAVLAMDQVFMLWTHLMRIYGIHKHFDQTNQYLGDNLVRALGVRPESLRAGLADFRLSMNYLGAQMNQFFVPNNLPLFQRHMWMCSNVYYDDPQQKSQMYVFTPATVWEYSPKTDTKGGELLPVDLYQMVGENPVDIKELVNVLTQLIQSINNDTDISLIYADIYKAYGESGVYKVPQIPEDFAMQPVYNKEVLDQISNATVVGRLNLKNDATSAFIKQENALIRSQMYTMHSSKEKADRLIGPLLLNYSDGEVTPERNMISTRLTANNAIFMADKNAAWITNFGSEIINTVEVFFTGQSEDAEASRYPMLWKTGAFSQDSVPTNIEFMYLFLVFYNRPNIICDPLNTSPGVDTRNLGNVGILNTDTLQSMHLTALMSEFDIPADHHLGE